MNLLNNPSPIKPEKQRKLKRNYMEEKESIGKLVRTLKNEFCPDCKNKLQLRTRDDIHLIDGENVIQKNNYHYCNKCEYFSKLKNEKFNRKRDWKPVEAPVEPEPIRKWDKNKKSFDNKSGGDKPKFSKRG